MALKPLSARPTAHEVMDDAPVIPVIVLQDAAQAVPLARALVAGGIRMLEVTMRTPVALACIEAIARDVPEAVAGAGTVRSVYACGSQRRNSSQGSGIDTRASWFARTEYALAVVRSRAFWL